MLKKIFLYLLFLISFFSHAQQSNGLKENFCVAMEADSLMRKTNPGMESLDDFESWLQQQIQKKSSSVNTLSAVIYTIPVIVHVIHNGEAVGSGSNISAAQVYSQIDVLNNDFRRRNADTTNTPSAFKPVAADIEIEFCLAKVDTNGNVLAEPGIHRVDRNSLNLSNPADYSLSYAKANIDPATIWNPKKYMNIWVLNLSGGVGGQGQFPNSSGLGGLSSNNGPASSDGVNMFYKCFGTTGTLLSGYNKGRTATHEVGHWLGLRHIWGDSNCGNDYCNDTPRQQAYNNGCPSFPHVTCTNGPNGDMFSNYMDYSSDGCKNIFTQDQKTRMRTVMQVCPRRVDLLTSNVCVAPVISNFTASAIQICEDDTVIFSDQSINNPTSWQWVFQGGTPSTSSLATPAVTYPASGIYNVTLSATNINGGTPLVKTAYINVNVKPRIIISPDTGICTGNSVMLTASGGGIYLWSPSSGLTDSTVANPICSVTLSTKYNLEVKNSFGCFSYDSVLVTVYPLPSAPVISQLANMLSSSPAVSYQWYLNGNSINGATSQTYTVSSNGTYAVEITDSNGCTNSSSSIVINASIQQLTKRCECTTNDKTIYVNADCISSGTSLIIYNAVGQVVFTRKLTSAYSLDLKNLAVEKGIYLISIYSHEDFFYKKIYID